MKRHYDNDLLSNIKNYILNGAYDIAEQKIEEYKILYPDDIIINKYQAQLLLKQGMYNEAENVCLNVINRSFHVNRLKSDMYITLSEVLYAQGRIDEAIEALENAYKFKDFNTQTIQIRLANLYAKAKNIRKAMEVLDKRESNAFNKNIDLQKAFIYLQDGKTEKALKLLLEISDNDLKSKIDIQRKNVLLGELYKKEKNFEKALYYYGKALIVKNDLYWKAYHAIGHIKYKMGYINEAILVLEEIIRKQKTDIVIETLVKCYLLKGYNDKAYQLINEFEDSYIKKVFLGRLEFCKQNFQEAEVILSDLINDPEYKDTRYHNYAYYYLIITKVRSKKYDEVLKILNNVVTSICFEDRYKRELNLLKYYINKELGNNIKPSNYSERQINNFSEELAINHIRSHHDNDYITEYTTSLFNDNVDIEKLYYYIKNNINVDNRIIHGFLDKYTIDFSNDMGFLNERNLRSVSAVCLPNTTDIITMYPDRYESVIDIKDVEKKEKPKVRRLSQIEKFNKRYKK